MCRDAGEPHDPVVGAYAREDIPAGRHAPPVMRQRYAVEHRRSEPGFLGRNERGFGSPGSRSSARSVSQRRHCQACSAARACRGHTRGAGGRAPALRPHRAGLRRARHSVVKSQGRSSAKSVRRDAARLRRDRSGCRFMGSPPRAAGHRHRSMARLSSCAGTWLRHHRRAGDGTALAAALRELGANPQAVVAMGWCTRVMLDAEFTREQAFAGWEGLLGALP